MHEFGAEPGAKRDADETACLDLLVEGTVQGVGFRPAAYRLAKSLHLRGTIENTRIGVRMILDGSSQNLERFVAALKHQDFLPGATIARITIVDRSPLGAADLRVVDSDSQSVPTKTHGAVVSADLATCRDCWAEVHDRDNRRYGYPFVSCSSCGPRYTILHSLPYDRANTSLAAFPMCEACRAEYGSPVDRRFHTQGMTCPACGPRVRILYDASAPDTAANHCDPIWQRVGDVLAHGGIVALKAIGGFHLLVNACDANAVSRLRARKRRPHQAFAVMARDMQCVRACADVDVFVEKLLSSPRAPIVIVPAPRQQKVFISPEVSPDNDRLGLMLPTTPLHEACFNAVDANYLVATSGNSHGGALCSTDHDAMSRLSGIADLIVTHSLPILHPCDDGVVLSRSRSSLPVRLGRGFAPLALQSIAHPSERSVLAMGAHSKTTVTLYHHGRLLVSPRTANLDHPEGLDAYHHLVESFVELHGQTPRIVAVDMHPDYASSHIGRDLADRWGADVVEVQHHHAHAAAALAESGLDEALALVYDGTGYGVDGTAWGGELLHATFTSFRRLGRFSLAPLPGGDRAIAEPWRQACGRLSQCFAADSIHIQDLATNMSASVDECESVINAARAGVGCAYTSSVGRLLDAIASFVGAAPRRITYEGQAAIRLEALAERARMHDAEILDMQSPAMIRLAPDGVWEVDASVLVRAVVSALVRRVDRAIVARAALQWIARASVDLLQRAALDFGIRRVILSGGVFQNVFLAETVAELLQRARFVPVEHRVLPPNDEGISVGQAIIAASIRGS